MNLQKLTDDEIENNLLMLAEAERLTLHQMILHIQEVNRRELWAARGFRSTMRYLIEKLKLSETAAYCRNQTAQFASEVPEALPMIGQGDLHLTQVCELQKSFREAEKIHQKPVPLEIKRQVLNSVAGCSTSDTQEICAKLLNLPIQRTEKIRTQADGSKVIQTTLTKTQCEKYEKVHDKLAHKINQAKRSHSIADVLETCFDEILTRTKTAVINEMIWDSLTPKRKRLILARDGCCQFVDRKSGRKCRSTHNLQVDHIQPIWAGGSNNPINLQALCATHNRHRYKQQSGRL